MWQHLARTSLYLHSQLLILDGPGYMCMLMLWRCRLPYLFQIQEDMNLYQPGDDSDCIQINNICTNKCCQAKAYFSTVVWLTGAAHGWMSLNVKIFCLRNICIYDMVVHSPASYSSCKQIKTIFYSVHLHHIHWCTEQNIISITVIEFNVRSQNSCKYFLNNVWLSVSGCPI